MKLTAIVLSVSACAFSAAVGAYEGFDSLRDPTQPTIAAKRAASAKGGSPGRQVLIAHGKRNAHHAAGHHG